MKNNFFRGLAPLTAVAFLALTGDSPIPAQAQPVPPPPNAQNPNDLQQPADVLPPDIASNAPLAEVIRLSQAAISEEIITHYINNSGVKFNLTASQIIYLKDIGVPDSAVMAMIQRDQQLGNVVSTPPPQAAPAPPPTTTVVTENYFYDSLAPYGTWVYVEGYGRCWRPAAVVYDSNWRPYCDHGHWVYTDAGWYWISDYSWGWAPFHYGRWFFDGRFGWCWWPDTVWAPSWVCWRYSNDYCGWAPLPPRCYYREGIGLVYNGVTVSASFNFGFGANLFIFVSNSRFCDPHPGHYRVPPTQVTQIYNQTTTINNITVVNNNGNGNHTTVVNGGIPPEHIATATHNPVHPVHIRDTTTPIGRGEQIDRNGTLVVNRPRFDHDRPEGSSDNGPHTIPSPTTGAPMQVPPPGRRGNSEAPGRGAGGSRNFSPSDSTQNGTGSVLPPMPANNNDGNSPRENPQRHPQRPEPMVGSPAAGENNAGVQPSQPGAANEDNGNPARRNPPEHQRLEPIAVPPSSNGTGNGPQPSPGAQQQWPAGQPAAEQSPQNNPGHRQPITSPRGYQPARPTISPVVPSQPPTAPPSVPAETSRPAPSQPSERPQPEPHYGAPYSSPRSYSPPPQAQTPPPGYGGNSSQGNSQGNGQGNGQGNSDRDKDKNGR